jgi:glyoxylase-like metal-dependent hydrolase (beta-lactamase superfamily II)
MFQNKSKRRILLITFIVAILVLPVVPVGAKKQAISSSIRIEKITSKITRFEETIPLNIPGQMLPPGAYYTASVYAVKVKGGIVLIDCGDETLADDLYKAVSKTYERPIKAVYLTHYHADHAGGGKYFQDIGIPVYGPAGDAGPIYLGADFTIINPNLPPIPEEFTYEGYVIDGTLEYTELEREFEIIQAPGHTPGAVHIKYTKGNKDYLFTADTILPMMADGQSQLDMTAVLTIGTAYENYLNENPGTFEPWSDQLTTLNGMLADISDYELVLTGHTPELNSIDVSTYIGYTIQILGSFEFGPPFPMP